MASGDAAEWGGGMQRLPQPAGGAEPAERVQGLRQAPQQDVVQVPRAQRLPSCRRLHPCRPPGSLWLNASFPIPHLETFPQSMIR